MSSSQALTAEDAEDAKDAEERREQKIFSLNRSLADNPSQ